MSEWGECYDERKSTGRGKGRRIVQGISIPARSQGTGRIVNRKEQR